MATAHRHRAVVVGAVLVAAGLTSPSASAASPPACEVVTESPDYRRDRTLLCVHRTSQSTPKVLAVSRDAGRSWRSPGLGGLARTGPTDIPVSASFSPLFARDRTIFATVSTGTYASTDLGETFTLLDPTIQGGYDGNPLPVLLPQLPLPTGSNAHSVHLANAARFPSLVEVESRMHRPVPGVPGLGARSFLAGRDNTVLALVHEVEAPVRQVALYRCDETLTCAERLFAFPTDLTVYRVQSMPDGSVVAILRTPSDDATVWRSADGGRTFATWDAVDAVLRPANLVTDQPIHLSVTANAALPGRWFLRVETSLKMPGRWPASAPPATQVFRSDDSGRHWRRVAFRRDELQRGSRGNAAWIDTGRGDNRALLHLTPDGRLLAAGTSRTALTLFCSLDGGVRWTVGCSR